MYCKLNGGWRATKLHYKLIQASYNLTLHLEVKESDYNSDKVNNTSKVDRNAQCILGYDFVKLATQPACNCWETSNTLVQPLLGSNQKNFFWRLLTEANSTGFY